MDVVAVDELDPLTFILTPSRKILGLLLADYTNMRLIPLRVSLVILRDKRTIEQGNAFINVQNQPVATVRRLVVVKGSSGFKPAFIAHEIIILDILKVYTFIVV